MSAERTLAGHRLRFHEKYVHGGKPFAPADLDGRNLADLFYSWCLDNLQVPLHKDGVTTWLEIEGVSRVNQNIVLARTCSGKWGEGGSVINVDSGKVEFSLEEHHAAAANTRGVLVCPPKGRSALFFSEYCQRGSGGVELMRAYVSHWRKTEGGITVEGPQRLIESEAVLQDAVIKSIEVHQYMNSIDLADSSRSGVPVNIYARREPKGGGMPIEWLNRLREKPLEAVGTLGLKVENLDNSKIYATIKSGRKERRILVTDLDDGLYYREVLNMSGQNPVSDEDLVKTCCEKAAQYLPDTGEEWDEAWGV